MIRRAIGERIAADDRNVFMRSDFADLGSRSGIGRALNQLVQDGALLRISRGLYARAHISPFTGKPAPRIGISRLVTEALNRLGIEVGPTAMEAAYNSGRSTQVPTGRVVGIMQPTRRRFRVSGIVVFLEPVERVRDTKPVMAEPEKSDCKPP